MFFQVNVDSEDILKKCQLISTGILAVSRNSGS